MAEGRVGLGAVATSDGGSPISVGPVGQRVLGKVLKGGEDRTSLAAGSSPCVIYCSLVSDHILLVCLTQHPLMENCPVLPCCVAYCSLHPITAGFVLQQSLKNRPKSSN